MRLHVARGSIGFAAHAALEEAGADYEVAWVDFAAKDQRGASYLALNPKGRVPALETPHGVLTETGAILDHVAATHPEAGLMPSDLWAAAKVREMFHYLAATVHVAHAHGRRAARWADDPAAREAMAAKVPANVTECMTLIEERFLAGPWVLGEAFSAADIHLHAIWRWAEGDGVDVAALPRLTAHGEAMGARPAIARVAALHDR